jgi:tRNA U34 5-carboxymethylaminomethyl modifying GTPase MnmE/TrmE
MNKTLSDTIAEEENKVNNLIAQITLTQVEISYAEHEDRKEDRKVLTKKLRALEQELYILRA